MDSEITLVTEVEMTAEIDVVKNTNSSENMPSVESLAEATPAVIAPDVDDSIMGSQAVDDFDPISLLNPEAEADETLLESQSVTDDDDSMKVQDIVLEHTDICKVDERKRSSTVNKLGYESFKLNIYKDKQSGFVTKRPLEWFKGLQQYLAAEEINNRCQKSTRMVNKVSKISICKIRFVSFSTKELTIQVNFVTGVFNVKGPTFSEWIQREFKKLEALVPPHQTDEPEPAVVTENVQEGETVATNVNIDEKDSLVKTSTDDPSSEIKKIWKYVHDMKTEDTNTQSEIKEIWNNLNEMKTAFGTIESSITDITSRIESNTESVNDRFNQADRKMRELEQRVEDKIVIYQGVNDNSLKQKCDKLTTDLNNKINSLKQVNKTFKEDIGQKIENLSQARVLGGPEISTEIDSLRKKIDAIDIPLLERDIQKTTEGYDEAVSAIHEKIGKLDERFREDIETNNVSIRLARNDLIRQSKALNESIDGIRAELLCNSTAVISDHPAANLQNLQNPPSSAASKNAWCQPLHNLNNTLTASNDQPGNTAEVRDQTDQPNIPRSIAQSHGGEKNTPKMPETDTTTELVIVMDSNARYIDFKKLWTLKGTDIRRKGNLRELNEVIDALSGMTSLLIILRRISKN